MRGTLFVCALLAFSCVCSASAAGLDSNYEALHSFIFNNTEEMLRLGSTPEPALVPLSFPCQLIEVSSEPPTSVHKLRPSDVNVVAALGDSITAAFGAESRNVLQLFNEYRGVSWSGGGEDTFDTLTTMPNILKKFNSRLFGYAIGTGGPKTEQAVFNIAVTGAVASDVPEQAQRLVEMMKTSTSVSWENDWKLITLWIGGNDLCAVCDDTTKYSAEHYQMHIQTVLDILQQIPRVFVNIVSILDISRLHELQFGLCDSFHKTVCPCVQRSDETRAIVSSMASQYQTAVNNIAAMGRYQTDTFAVVVQPFFQQTEIPKKADGQYDRSFFAPDCFHFAGKAQAAAAVGLWNNMLEPQGSKHLSWGLGQLPKCPTRDQPYICSPTNQCGASSDLQSLHPTGGQAPPQTMTIEQRTMLGLALVLIVAVPIALFAYLRWRRTAQRQQDYLPLPGSTHKSVNNEDTTV